jgi:nicotine blue oxidoreductase
MVDAVILAAGLGTRYGCGPKPLMSAGNGTVLARTIRVLREGGAKRVLVVVGHEADQVAAEARRAGAEPIENPAYRTGLASSLAAGIDHVANDVDGFLVAPADLPGLPVTAVRAVLRAANRGASIARPVVRGQPGFPVYLRVAHRASLRASLRGDRGARDYIRRHADELVALALDEEGCVADTDRPPQRPPGKEGERGVDVRST